MSVRLALDGGTPVRDPAARPWPAWPAWEEADEAALLRVLHSGSWWSGSGAEGIEFAQEFAAHHAAAFAVPCTSGTAALEIALRALRIGPGDAVICPAYTFVATASAILAVGAVPLWADCEADTLNIDPTSVETKITPQTRAIIAVHVAGRPADLDALNALAKHRGVFLLEDAAQAHGAEWRGRRVGALGAMGTFSFQASKNLNVGEGGIVVTDSAALADAAWSVANVGHLRHADQAPIAGSNFRMTEFQAALLRAQLLRLPEQTATRNRNAAQLCAQLEPFPGLCLPAKDLRITAHAYHLFTFRLDLPRLSGRTRDDFVRALVAEGIPASSGYMPLYRNPLLVRPGNAGAQQDTMLPVCEQVCADTIWLPQNLLLGTETDMENIAEAIGKILGAWK